VGNISNYLEEVILDWVFRGNSGNHSPPSALYLGIAELHANTPSELEQGNLSHEITGYNGDRKLITFGTISQNSEGKAQIKNTNTIEFENMPAVTVGYAFISDSPTKGEGNVLWWMPLETPKTTNSGDTLRVPAEAITITLD
jgi:hypothetical protein